MKKIQFAFFVSISFIMLFISCKHEIPDGTNNIGGGGGSNPPTTTNCSPDTAYFQQQVLPIFISNCAMSGCHDPASHQKGIVLSTYTTIMGSGEITPGNPGNSKIYKKIIDTDPGDRMPPPPRNPLPQAQAEIIRKWILQGAKNNSCASATCDTTNVTYSGAIKNIISNKCQGCHSSSSPGGGIDLSAYAGVKAKINDGKLWGAINHMPGFSAMPKGGAKLSTCELAQIKKWMDAGSLNN